MTRKSRAKPKPEPVDVPSYVRESLVEMVLAGDITATDAAAEVGAPVSQVTAWVRAERAIRAEARERKRLEAAAGPAERLGAIFATAGPGVPLPIPEIVREVSRLPEGLVEILVEDDTIILDTQTILSALATRRWARDISACVTTHPRAPGRWIFKVDWTVAGIHLRGGLRLVSRSPLGRDGLKRDVSAVVRLGSLARDLEV